MEDAKMMGKIQVEAFYESHSKIVPFDYLSTFTLEGRQRYYFHVVSNNLENNAVLTLRDDVLAFITYVPYKDPQVQNGVSNSIEISGLFVHPLVWRRGLGTALINWITEHCLSEQLSLVFFWVIKEHTVCREFLENQGFVHDGTEKLTTLTKPIKHMRYVKEIVPKE
jgi:GNAT superfamily N-acetyltransferase